MTPDDEEELRPHVRIACQGADTIDIQDLNELQGNLKSLSKDRYLKLKTEILETGFAFPIAVWMDPEGKAWIVGGHQRKHTLDAMRMDGFVVPPIPVNYVEAADAKEARRRVLQDIAQYGEVERQGLYEFMEAAEIGLPDLRDSFALPDLDMKSFALEFFDDNDGGGKDPNDAPSVPVEPSTQRGDIYQLGAHRLRCGDSASIEEVQELMAGEFADLLWTDPPYGVSYGDKNASMNARDGGNRITKQIENDEKKPDEMNEFWFSVLRNAHEVLTDRSSYYIASPQGGDLMMMMMMSIIRAGFQLKHMLVWVKNNHVLGRCDYNYKHEPILYGWKEDGTHEFIGEGNCKSSVWEFPKPQKNDLHPTMKPVELVEEAILNSCRRGGLVLDLFGGSGSTMIACEKAKRRCFMMELDPRYCDVIVQRWEAYTGLKAQLLQTASAPIPERGSVE